MGTSRRSWSAYGLLLRLLPRGFRQRHGAEMEELLAEELKRAAGSGRITAVAKVWVAAIWDVLGRAPVEHWRGWSPVKPRRRRELMIASDVRYAVRRLSRQPALSALVVGMLGLGVAASLAVFSLVNGLYLRPLPFPEAERLVYLNERAPRWDLEYVGINYPDFDRWRADARLFEAMALMDDMAVNLSEGGEAERLVGGVVTHDYARVLGLRPVLGRMFTPGEDRPGGARVVVLSEDLWRRRFGGDPSILGRTLRLNSVSHEVVGVLPRVAEFPEDTDLWLPMAGDPAQPYQGYSGQGIGRLMPGVTAAQAEQDLLRAHAPIFEERDEERVVTPVAEPLRGRYVGRYRTMALALGGAVAIVLLIACSNVASVMLARAIARQHEMGIRTALGAARPRLVRQLFVESLVYASAGGAVGLGVGYAAVRILSATVPDQFPDWARFGVDGRVLLFALLLTGMTAVLFGLAPAFHAFGGDERGALNAGGARTTAGARGRRTLALLIVGEVALSAMLLVGGGLLLRAYQRLTQVDAGFDTVNVLTFGISLPPAKYDTAPKLIGFWESLTQRLAVLPGVEHAAAITCPPLACHQGNFLEAEGAAPPAPGDADPVTLNRIATPGYFEAMGIELVRGRFFEEGDGRSEGSRAVIVNETLARRFWPDEPDAIGKRIRFRGGDPAQPWMTVVGVTRDVKHYGLDEEMRPGIYQPLAQNAVSAMTVVIKAGADPTPLAGAARDLVRELDADLPIYQVGTMEDRLRESLALREAYAWLLSVFAGAALLLAVGGIYGVTSYAVSRRTREIGIRVALGARAGQVTRAVLRSGMGIVCAGMLLGLLGALAGARSLSSLLFGVDPADPLVYGLVALLLAGTALAATWVPARRAARVDPMTSLRNE